MAQPDRSSLIQLFEGVLGVAYQIQLHLLQLSRVPVDRRKAGFEIHLDVDFSRGEAEALQFRGSHDDLIREIARRSGKVSRAFNNNCRRMVLARSAS